MIRVDVTVKQVAIVLQGDPITKQKLCVECGTAFYTSYVKAKDTHKSWAEKWDDGGYMKIVLKCPDNETFVKIFDKTVSWKLPYAISDRILVIGPAPSNVIDTITGGLKLL
jgi:peptidyl-tRNA hydrolase